eukprot:XP_011674524.1 PREDICTED: uncharacterized protein LOC105443256 [Strongylocentrotus purpuratus]
MAFDREESFDLAEEVLLALNQEFDDVTHNRYIGFHTASSGGSEVNFDASSISGTSVVDHVSDREIDSGSVDDMITSAFPQPMWTSDLQTPFPINHQYESLGENSQWPTPHRYHLRDQRQYFQQQQQQQFNENKRPHEHDIQPKVKQENTQSCSSAPERTATTLCAKSTRTVGKVGRKPPKGPDGNTMYSKRRATEVKRESVNMRERDRMHQLRDAFELLRRVLPRDALDVNSPRAGGRRLQRYPVRQKCSKVDTLLLAQDYILTLQEMCKNSPEALAEAPSSSTSAW